MKKYFLVYNDYENDVHVLERFEEESRLCSYIEQMLENSDKLSVNDFTVIYGEEKLVCPKVVVRKIEIK